MKRLLIACILSFSACAQSGLGIFAKSGDVGAPAIKGSTGFDVATGQYNLTGSGVNIWGKQDQFQYVWKEMTGNFSVTATMHFLGTGADHRKAGIMVRQSDDTDAAYADVLMHGNGMPALQWRSKAGEDTNTFDLPVQTPGTFRLKMVRNGVKMYLYLGTEGAEPKEIVHTEVSLSGPVLVGLVVCAHDPAVSEKVVFSDVTVEALAPTPPPAVPPSATKAQ